MNFEHNSNTLNIELVKSFQHYCSQFSAKSAEIYLYQKGNTIVDSFNILEKEQAVIFSPLICLIKPFTATLIGLCLDKHLLKFDTPIKEIFPCVGLFSSQQGKKIAKITILELLSHTHGLGGLSLKTAPINNAGCIDEKEVFKSIQYEGILFNPGEYFSYSNIGYILLGIILENIFELQFSEILYNNIINNLTLDSFDFKNEFRITADYICPASGKGLEVTSRGLANFSKIYANSNQKLISNEIKNRFLNTKIKIPGWSNFVKNGCIGWKSFGNGWFGHNGGSKHSHAIVRFNVIENIVFAGVANSSNGKISPSLILSSVINQRFPKIAGVSVSEHLIDPSLEIRVTHPVIGDYGNLFLKYKIRMKVNKLTFSIHEGDGNGNYIKSHECLLYPSDNYIFFLSNPWQYVSFIQLIKSSNRKKMYLWDHGQVFPRFH